MAIDQQRSKGRPQSYKFDRGGTPTEFGPYIGEVRNNVDPVRSGRIQVYIKEFAGDNKDDVTLWRTLSYCPPFYGVTRHTGTDKGDGGFVGNQHSYGMWFTPPDIGTRVLCFFAGGDPDQGFYTGSIIELGLTHMIPGIAGTSNYKLENDGQKKLLSGIASLPTTEINNEDQAVAEGPRFFDNPKPVHASQATAYFQQGLIGDPVRGPVSSSSQRESPSRVYGVSTPGRPVYQGGLDDNDVKQKLESGEVKPQDVGIVGRRGGHSFVMDDGDINGSNNLMRIRTSKGHQITMSDDGDCFYITHANGQSWIELGKEGTVDVFSTNSVNVRTLGSINLHADADININAGGSINMKAAEDFRQQSTRMEIKTLESYHLQSDQVISILSDGTVAIAAVNQASVDGGDTLDMNAGSVGLNSRGSLPTVPVSKITENIFPDIIFVPNQGWSLGNTFTSITTRTTTHEPFGAHNLGIDVATNLTTQAPDEQRPPEGWNVARTS